MWASCLQTYYLFIQGSFPYWPGQISSSTSSHSLTISAASFLHDVINGIVLLFSFRVGGKSRENGEQREGGSNGGFIPAFGMRHFSLAAGQQEGPTD